MLTAKQVAEYLLSLVEEETGELISNLKIQKHFLSFVNYSLSKNHRYIIDDFSYLRSI